MKVVPAPLTKDVSDFEYQLNRMIPYCDTFQIDIQDGLYVPSITYTAQDLLTYVSSVNQSRLSVFQKATYDFHLMEKDSSNSLEALRALQKLLHIRYVFVHVDVITRPEFRQNSLSFTLCPVFSPPDSLATNALFGDKPLLDCPAIQIMTIHPGPQGQTFMPGQLEKIHVLRLQGYKGTIFIDGGVNAETFKMMQELPPSYQPDVLCVGSYFSKAPTEELPHRIALLSR